MTVTITVSSHVENGDPGNIILLDSRLRGNDKKGDGNDNGGVIPSKEGIQELYILDSRLRGNDREWRGNDREWRGNDKI
ncbi:MAG: hypothetical protein SFT93_03375 [Rickettsiaceae bacterium]|nr:hypothetical protein [Rickettsiaceae bacterium]